MVKVTEAPGQAVVGKQIWVQVTEGPRSPPNREEDFIAVGVFVGALLNRLDRGTLALGGAELAGLPGFWLPETKAMDKTTKIKPATLPKFFILPSLGDFSKADPGANPSPVLSNRLAPLRGLPAFIKQTTCQTETKKRKDFCQVGEGRAGRSGVPARAGRTYPGNRKIFKQDENHGCNRRE